MRSIASDGATWSDSVCSCVSYDNDELRKTAEPTDMPFGGPGNHVIGAYIG